MLTIPRVGLGTWQSPPQLVTDAVKEAIKAGYRHIDCAYVYENEEAVGKGIRDMIDSGVIRREELWVTTKLWGTFHEPHRVEEGIRASLKSLGLDYVDLYLIHNQLSFQYGQELIPMKDGKPDLIDVPIAETWKAMEKLIEKNLTTRVGVSNFSIALLEKLRYSKGVKIRPFANQVEMHPYFQQEAMVEYLCKRGIQLMAYSPLGSPGTHGTDPQKNILNDPKVVEIAKEVGKTPAQVILRFLLDLSPCVSVIPKSVNPDRIKENISLDFTLDSLQMNKLITLETGERGRTIKDVFKGTKIDLFGDDW